MSRIINKGYCTRNDNLLFEIRYELKRSFFDFINSREGNKVVIEIRDDGSIYQETGMPYKRKDFKETVCWVIDCLREDDEFKSHILKLVMAMEIN